MADTKITALTPHIGSNVATNDVLPIVDVSDTTMASSGTTKKISIADLLVGLNVPSLSLLSFGAANVGTTVTARFLVSGYTPNPAPISGAAMRMAAGGYLKNLRVQHNTLGTGGGITYTLRVNGVDSALTTTVSAGSPGGADTTNVVPVAADDLIEVRVTKSAGITLSPADVTATIEVQL